VLAGQVPLRTRRNGKALFFAPVARNRPDTALEIQLVKEGVLYLRIFFSGMPIFYFCLLINVLRLLALLPIRSSSAG
jgi:hypothetical protein